MVHIASWRICCDRSSWCVLDALMSCKVRWICDKHDAWIQRDCIHCGDDTCADDHG